MIGTKVEWSREGYHWTGEVVDRGRDGWLVETPLGQQRWMSDAEVRECRVRPAWCRPLDEDARAPHSDADPGL